MSLSKLTATPYSSLGGLLYFISGVIILMGIITAEVYYPQYSTLKHYISDLGSTRPPNPVSFEPSRTIFNGAMIVSGILIFIASLTRINVTPNKVLFVPSLFLGIGVLGIGIFPGENYFTHPMFALMAFVSGGIAGLTGLFSMAKPYKFVSAVLGGVALTFLVFFDFFSQYFGVGGAERWIAYPIILWLCSYGSYLMGNNSN